MNRRTGAIPPPKMIAATKKYRILGTPTRKISILPSANKAPAMPVPPGIFETLICGFGVPSLILHLLSSGYHGWAYNCSVAKSLIFTF